MFLHWAISVKNIHKIWQRHCNVYNSILVGQILFFEIALQDVNFLHA